MLKNILLSILVFIFLFSCSKKENDILYIGTYAEDPPYGFFDENGEIAGFDIDYINAIAEIIGKKIDIKHMTFEGLLPALESKKIDIAIAGMVSNEQRAKTVDFSKPYYTGKQAIVVKVDDDSITSLESLTNNKTVAVSLGYLADSIVSGINGIKKINRLTSNFACILEIKNNKADAAVMSFASASGFAKTNPEIKVIPIESTTQHIYIAFRKGDSKLVEEVNRAIDILKENGIYDTLVEKYFN